MMNQGLFYSSDRRLSPGKSIHHDINSAIILIGHLSIYGSMQVELFTLSCMSYRAHLRAWSTSHLDPKLEKGSIRMKGIKN